MENSEFDFTAFLLDIVSQYGEAAVPGLGVFSGVLVAAKADPVQGVVLPPRVKYSFSAQGEEQGRSLVLLVAEQRKITVQAADVLIANAVEDIWNKLRLPAPVVFQGMGVLRMDSFGSLKFEAVHPGSNPLTFGLDKIEANALMRKPVDVQQPPMYHPTKESIAQEAISSKPKITKYARWYWVMLVLLVLSTLTYLAIRFGGLGVQDASKPEPTNKLVEAVPAPSADTIAILDTIASTESKQVDSAKTSVIAIGLFRDSANVARLVQRITTEGFTPFTAREGMLTRVGITFSYWDEKEISEKLEEVRRTFEPGAFLLKE